MDSDVWNYLLAIDLGVSGWQEWLSVLGSLGSLVGGIAAVFAIRVWLRDRANHRNPFKFKQATYYEEYYTDKKPLLRILMVNRLDRTIKVNRVGLLSSESHRIETVEGTTNKTSVRGFTCEDAVIKNDSGDIKFNETLEVEFRFETPEKAKEALDNTELILLNATSGEWLVRLRPIKTEVIKVYRISYSDVSYSTTGKWWMYFKHFIWEKSSSKWIKRKLFGNKS